MTTTPHPCGKLNSRCIIIPTLTVAISILWVDRDCCGDWNSVQCKTGVRLTLVAFCDKRLQTSTTGSKLEISQLDLLAYTNCWPKHRVSSVTVKSPPSLSFSLNLDSKLCVIFRILFWQNYLSFILLGWVFVCCVCLPVQIRRAGKKTDFILE